MTTGVGTCAVRMSLTSKCVSGGAVGGDYHNGTASNQQEGDEMSMFTDPRSGLVLCDHHDGCLHPDFNCEHRQSHTPVDDCERGGGCGDKPGILEWCKCIPQNAEHHARPEAQRKDVA